MQKQGKMHMATCFKNSMYKKVNEKAVKWEGMLPRVFFEMEIRKIWTY